jgi:cytochrome c oxidase subunit II
MYSGLLLDVPPTTSTYDSLLNWYLLFGIGAGVIVVSLLAFFMVRYRSRGERTPAPAHRTEGWKIVLVTVIISISILSAAEYQTFASFSNIQVPDDPTCIKNTGLPCVHINVLAYQWGWNFTYPNGKYELNNLTVPAGRDVVMNITSRDVFHSFGISMLAVKEDAIPGKTNQLWFLVPEPGFFDNAIRCFELCGVGHTYMWANLTVVSQPTWNTWMGS